MPSFIKALQVLGDNTEMGYVNYQNIAQNHKEFLLPSNWDLYFTKKPAAVYFPGDDIIRARCATVEPSVQDAISGVEHTVRGYTIKQKTSTNTSGTCTINFIDREDQAIVAFVTNWRECISDPETKFSFRTEDTYADIQYRLFNTSRIAVRQLRMLKCQPSDATLPESSISDAEVSSTLAEIPLALDFDHYSRKLLNV